jgi:hypothetical protein
MEHHATMSEMLQSDECFPEVEVLEEMTEEHWPPIGCAALVYLSEANR